LCEDDKENTIEVDDDVSDISRLDDF